MEQFPWTESGLELLLKINICVQQNGGRDKFANDLESEWVIFKPTSSYHQWTIEQRSFVMKNYRVMKQKDIAASLGLTYHAIKHIVRRLQQQGKLGYIKTKNNGH